MAPTLRSNSKRSTRASLTKATSIFDSPPVKRKDIRAPKPKFSYTKEYVARCRARSTLWLKKATALGDHNLQLEARLREHKQLLNSRGSRIAELEDEVHHKSLRIQDLQQQVNFYQNLICSSLANIESELDTQGLHIRSLRSEADNILLEQNNTNPNNFIN